MPRGNRHTRQAMSSLGTGVHFEPLEPRLLLSGTTEGVVVESRLPDEYQTNQSVVEAQILTVADEEISTAPESLSILEQDPSTLPAAPDDLDESSLSADDGDLSISIGIFSNEMPTFDVLEDASKDTEIEAVSDISESGSDELIEESAPSEVVSPTAVTEDTQADGEALSGLDETGSTDTTDITDVLTDVETGDLDTEIAESDDETEDILLGEDITPDSSLSLPEEESEILSDSALQATDAVSDTADEGVRNELVFVNDDVADYDQLTEDLLTGMPDDRDITVVTLDSEQNGIKQVSSILAESEDIDAVHFVSHGTDRSVKLGGTWLQDTDLDTYSDAISGWGDSLTGDADLVFYGCNLAGGDRGRELLETFGELTDADVAASADATGHTLLRGDWELEYKAGSIETGVVYSEGLQQSWTALLGGQAPTTSNKTVSTNEDTTYTLLLSDFNYNDPESDPLDHVQITSLETVGSLELSGAPVTLHQTITAAQITAGELKFVPVGDESGAGYDTFQFRVHDGTNYSAEVSSVTLLNATFGADAEGFTYADDTFGTSDPGQATGTYEAAGGSSGGGLRVYLGLGPNGADTSGGWSKDVSLGAESIVTVSLNYRMLMGEGYEADEYGEVVMEIDGTRYGNDTNNSIVHMIGNGNGGGDDDTGWQYEEIEVTLSAGNHTLTLGGYNNKATANDEYVEVFLDEVTVSELTFNTMTVDVTAENDTPVVGAPVGALAVNEQADLAIHNTGFTVSDVDEAGAGATATLNVTEGTITVAEGNSGVTITGGTNGTDTVTLSGTIAQLNNLLTAGGTGTITYRNSSDTPSATATFTVTVNDSGNTGTDPGISGGVADEEGTNNVTINITPVNDMPVVTPTVADLAYTENVGAVILDGGITVADVDNTNLKGATIQIAGNYKNGEDTLTFVDQNGIAGVWNAGNGTLTLTGTTTKANYQTALQSIKYTNGSEDPNTDDRTVTFTVTDEGNLASDAGTRGITVASVNDTPVANDATFTVAEDAADSTVVGTVTATDLDTGDTLTYSITAGNDDGIFAIDSATGKITIADKTKLDYEAAASHDLTIKVTDDGTGALSDTAAITVNITNINEVLVADDATLSVAEDASNSAVVGTVTATDPDAGDTLTYSITAGNDDGVFAINSATGEITVMDNSNLNYESKTSYGLTVKVEDAGGLTDTAAITVNVTNVNEDPSVSSASYSIDEHSADGSAVGTLTGSDPDAGDSLTYSIIAGNDQGLFSINSATGAITVNNGIDLDFEISPTHTLTIRVTDSGSPALSETATVTINLNDVFEAAAAEADPEPDPEEPEEAEPDDTASDTEPEPVDDTGTTDDQTEGDLSGSVIDDEDPTDNDTDQEDDTETEEETDSENQTEGLPQNLPSDSRDGSNAVSRKKHNPDKREGKAKTSVKNRKESKQAAESNMEEMLLINPQGKPESRREMALSKDAAEFSTIGSEEKISAPAKAIITNRTMQRELDSINKQIDEAAKRMESRAKLIAGTAMGVSAALMGGYALWAFRGISLMASSFASLPVWQFFDPLPILSDWEGNSQTTKVGGKNDEDIIDEDEKKLRTIFDKS